MIADCFCKNSKLQYLYKVYDGLIVSLHLGVTKGVMSIGVYEEARQRTRTAIIEAFWRLYEKKDISKITVKDITEKTGIHRATFYLYFDNVYDVLQAIKSDQLEKLRYVCTTYISSENNYADFLAAMRKLYDDNEVYLEPLLYQYHRNRFAEDYREIMKNKLRSDIGWQEYPKESIPYLIIDLALNGLIETFISCLQTRKIPLDQSYQYASKSVEEGIAPALEEVFDIHIKK